MKPIIGIIGRVEKGGGTSKLAINEPVRRAVIRHGGIPMAILLTQDFDYTMTKNSDQPDLTEEEKEMVLREVDLVDGIIMPGGSILSKNERYILNYAIEKDKPILGICLGMQFMASFGMDKLPNEPNATGVNHCVEGDGYVHYVTLDKTSKLYQILGKDRFMVNSRHNYHVVPNNLYDVVALSDDNLVEAIEFKDKKFAIGVQWHPEDLDDEQTNKLFDEFIKKCKE